MNVDVLSVDGEKYAIGKSLSNALGIMPENFDTWVKRLKERRNLVRGVDYIDSEEGILFSCEAAAGIYEQANKPKAGPRHTRENGVKRDEYGLPVLPPRKTRGVRVLINPYRI